MEGTTGAPLSEALMQMPRPSEQDRNAFLALVPERADVTVRPMFGNLGAFVNGNMFMGLFGPDIGVKLRGADRQELLAVEGAGPFGPADRPMSSYVALPRAWRDRPDLSAEWISRSLDHVAALPAKKGRTG